MLEQLRDKLLQEEREKSENEKLLEENTLLKSELSEIERSGKCTRTFISLLYNICILTAFNIFSMFTAIGLNHAIDKMGISIAFVQFISGIYIIYVYVMNGYIVYHFCITNILLWEDELKELYNDLKTMYSAAIQARSKTN
jgi:uncharacterized membrane protein (DUF485 family)